MLATCRKASTPTYEPSKWACMDCTIDKQGYSVIFVMTQFLVNHHPLPLSGSLGLAFLRPWG